MLVLLASCSERPDAGAPDAQPPSAPSPSKDNYALGSQLTPAGAVSADAAGEQFSRGGEVFLSVTISGARSDQTIGVEWVDPRGRIIRKDTRTVAREAEYAPFSSGSTAKWRRGPYRAVVIINGRRVTEREFALM